MILFVLYDRKLHTISQNVAYLVIILSNPSSHGGGNSQPFVYWIIFVVLSETILSTPTRTRNFAVMVSLTFWIRP